MPDSPLIGRRPDFARVAAYERACARGVPPDHARNLAIAEALLAEAIALGVWPPTGPHDIAHKLRLARAINTPVPVGADGLPNPRCAWQI